MASRGSNSESPRNQEERILWLLQAAWPAWTPAPTLSRVSLQYNARIHGLRKKGWQIANRVETHNGVKHGSFRLATPGTFPNPKNKRNQPHSPSTPIGVDGEGRSEIPEYQLRKSLSESDTGTLFSLEEMVSFDHDAKHYPE